MTSAPRSGATLQHGSPTTGQYADRDDKTTMARCANTAAGARPLRPDAHFRPSLPPRSESARSEGTLGGPSAQRACSEADRPPGPCTAWLSACSPKAEDIPPTRMGAGQPPHAATRCPPGDEDIPPTRVGAGGPPKAAAGRIAAWATTLVVRNLPKDASLSGLLEVWVPDGSYNLVYYPYNMKGGTRLGYCFIDFASHGAALEFAEAWHARPFPGSRGGKALDIVSARVQGVAAALERFRGRRIELMTDPELLPAVFHGTQRQDVRKILLSLGLVTMPSPGDGSVRL